MSWILRHQGPLLAGGCIAVGVGVVTALYYRRPSNLLRDSNGPLSPELDAIADAIRATRAEGLLSMAEATAINHEFISAVCAEHGSLLLVRWQFVLATHASLGHACAQTPRARGTFIAASIAILL